MEISKIQLPDESIYDLKDESARQAIQNVRQQIAQADGINLIINTYSPDINNPPKIITETNNSTIGNTQIAATARHGIKSYAAVTDGGYSRPFLRLGSNNISKATLPLTPGETYTISFFYSCKLFSGTGSSDADAFFVAFYDNSASSAALARDFESIIIDYNNNNRGQEYIENKNRFFYTFTVPLNITKMYIQICPTAGGVTRYGPDDYIELRDLKLEKGGIATNYSPAPEDLINIDTIVVSGSTPTITALAGKRYICGEVSTLDITLPDSGIIDVVFESGSTPTVLTITPPTDQTVKWTGNFDPTTLDANTIYEINIADCLGVGAGWT